MSTALRSLLPPPSPVQMTTPPLSGDAVDLCGALLRPAADVAIVGWLRHYGCTLCQRQAVEWQTDLRERVGPRARLVLVGCGTVEQAQTFREDAKWTGDLFTDPDRSTYRSLEFERGAKSVFNCVSLVRLVFVYIGCFVNCVCTF